MLKVVITTMVAAGLAVAQTKPLDPLFGLRDRAEKTAADWQTLAEGLESKLTRLLPCDPKMKSTIEEVVRASETRMTALIEYLREAAARARQEERDAQKMLAEVDGLSAQVSAEAADAEQFRAGLEALMNDLLEGAKRRASLNEPWKALQEIAKSPAGLAQGIEAQKEALREGWRDLIPAMQARRAALDAELSAASTENSRWSSYYAARLARTQIECNVTRGTAATPAPVKKTPPRKKK